MGVAEAPWVVFGPGRKRTTLPSRKSFCQDGALSCLPRIPVTPNHLLCVALAIIFLLVFTLSDT